MAPLSVATKVGMGRQASKKRKPELRGNAAYRVRQRRKGSKKHRREGTVRFFGRLVAGDYGNCFLTFQILDQVPPASSLIRIRNDSSREWQLTAHLSPALLCVLSMQLYDYLIPSLCETKLLPLFYYLQVFSHLHLSIQQLLLETLQKHSKL